MCVCVRDCVRVGVCVGARACSILVSTRDCSQAQQAAQGLLKRKGMKKASALISNALLGAKNQHRLNDGKLDPASLQVCDEMK